MKELLGEVANEYSTNEYDAVFIASAKICISTEIGKSFFSVQKNDLYGF